MTALARAYSIALRGLSGTPIEVQTHIGPGIVGTTLVGLPDASLREAKERVRAALFSCGIPTLNRRVTVNLSPADLPKSGSGFDVAIAVSMLAARKVIEQRATVETVFYAELGLDGSLQPVPGVLPAALAAKDAGFTAVVVPPQSTVEARLVTGLRVIPCAHLEDIVKMLSDVGIRQAGGVSGAWQHVQDLAEASTGTEPAPSTEGSMVPTGVGGASKDLEDVRGQDETIWALAVAAVGAHHVLLKGTPGVGKSMLAARLPALLPDLKDDEALTVTALHSLSGPAHVPNHLARRPPLQSPHHSATLVSLIGGGNPIQPGAVSLAHEGVLLLDEAPEFQARTLDALRQPLERGSVTIHRARGHTTFPARFQMVMTANPCPCGGMGGTDESTGRRGCTCSWVRKRNYWSRLSGPLLDRVDVNVDVPKPHRSDLVKPPTYTTAQVAELVVEARKRSAKRWQDTPWRLNGEVPGKHIRSLGNVPSGYLATLDSAVDEGIISYRGADRILRLAWSSADLVGATVPGPDDFALAMKLRGEIGNGKVGG